MLNSQEKKPGKRIRIFSVYVSEEAVERVGATLRSGYLGEGPVVKEFELALKKIGGIPYPVALNSGTSALHLALVITGVKAQDEVITTAQTMMATGHAILQQQARPVFADIQYQTGNIDSGDIEHRITDKTKAIIVVHWAGYPCDLDEIHAVAKKHNLTVIEDAAHALGAFYKSQPIGQISPFTCFSFQAIKHVTCGDGGALAVLTESKYREALRRRWYGIDRAMRKPSILGEPEWNVTETGFKYHMNDVAASIGLANLKYLPQLLKRRAQIAVFYRRSLKNVQGITLLESKSDRASANWLFTMHVEKRENFVRMMSSKGIEVSVVHLRIDENDIFGGKRGDLVNLNKFNSTQISIPIHNLLSDDDVSYIVDSIKAGW